MYTDTLSVISLVLFMTAINTLNAKNYLDVPFGIYNTSIEKTTLKVALYPYLPDSAGDNFTNLLHFIEKEFDKVQPDISLQLRPLNQNDDFYSLTTLNSWLSSSGNGYDVVEIDTLILGNVVNAGLITPQFSTSEVHSDWHAAAASAVQFNQAVYAYPHLMCAFFLFTRDDEVANITTIDQLINILGPDATTSYRLVGNLDSSWGLPSLWINSYQNTNNVDSNIVAFALHSYQSKSFETMRKLAQLCDRTGEDNNCLNGIFKDNPNMPSLLFASKQTAAMFGFSERLSLILENGDSDDYSKIKMFPLPLGTTGNEPTFFTDAFVFRRNMSDNVLKAARSFVEFMGTPRMQAAVVGSGDTPNTKPRYLLPISKNAYNESLLANDRFFQQYFRTLGVGYSYPTAGFLNARKEIQAAIVTYIGVNNSKSSSSITISLDSNLSPLLFFVFYLLH